MTGDIFMNIDSERMRELIKKNVREEAVLL